MIDALHTVRILPRLNVNRDFCDNKGGAHFYCACVYLINKKGRVCSKSCRAMIVLLFSVLLSLSWAQGKLRVTIKRHDNTFLLACIDGSDAPVFEPLFSSDGVTFTVDEGAAEGS